MRRREFIAGLGSAVAWPHVAGAQQPAVAGDRVARWPVAAEAQIPRRFPSGSREAGFVEGRECGYRLPLG